MKLKSLATDSVHVFVEDVLVPDVARLTVRLNVGRVPDDKMNELIADAIFALQKVVDKHDALKEPDDIALKIVDGYVTIPRFTR